MTTLTVLILSQKLHVKFVAESDSSLVIYFACKSYFKVVVGTSELCITKQVSNAAERKGCCSSWKAV